MDFPAKEEISYTYPKNNFLKNFLYLPKNNAFLKWKCFSHLFEITDFLPKKKNFLCSTKKPILHPKKKVIIFTQKTNFMLIWKNRLSGTFNKKISYNCVKKNYFLRHVLFTGYLVLKPAWFIYKSAMSAEMYW